MNIVTYTSEKTILSAINAASTVDALLAFQNSPSKKVKNRIRRRIQELQILAERDGSPQINLDNLQHSTGPASIAAPLPEVFEPEFASVRFDPPSEEPVTVNLAEEPEPITVKAPESPKVERQPGDFRAPVLETVPPPPREGEYQSQLSAPAQPVQYRVQCSKNKGKYKDVGELTADKAKAEKDFLDFKAEGVNLKKRLVAIHPDGTEEVLQTEKI